MCYKQKEVQNGVTGEGQGSGSSEEDDAAVDVNVNVNVNGMPAGAIQVRGGSQIPQHQPHNSLIRWERFLPFRSLKVLLVENDDSTRHVVSALLQNCSYEVTAVANGLQAWKILEDLNNHIDIVLTEVVMPILSGIGLLYKIMNHKTFKNIPVIMMSAHDSMGIVFKCLSKGAVDFLVKPIRKNELKNLWQHVWRRCHSSSGSGSESGTRTKTSGKSKSNEDMENNTDSSNEFDDSDTNGLNDQHGSDNGSGTQSSWTKMAAEFDSPQPVSPSSQRADAPDSTSAQVIHTNHEMLGNRKQGTETKECLEKNENQGLEIGALKNADMQGGYQCDNLGSQSTSKRQRKLSQGDSKPLENGLLKHSSENISTVLRDPIPKAISSTANSINPHVESKTSEACNSPDISQVKDREHCNSGELPSLELTLKWLRGVGDGGNVANDDRNVIRHSDLSAFSKYNTASVNQGPAEKVGSCSPLANSYLNVKTEMTHNIPFQLSSPLLNQQSNGSSNKNDIASTAKNAIPKLEALNDKPESSSAFKSCHTSAFQPVQNGQTCSPQQVITGKVENVGVNGGSHFKGPIQYIQVQHHHHHHNHYHHHAEKQHQSQPDDYDCLSLKNMAAAAPQCGSSNMVGGTTEGNTGNCSMNGSASGSNHGSNGQNGSSNNLNTAQKNTESDNKAAANGGSDGIGGIITGDGVDEDRIAQREAALSKFRQKRKERCFEKRVRYQSRKKLAEQRPRVKGQFVRQIWSDDKGGRDCQSNDLTSEENSCESVR
ncbi:hypothetical protein Tsubulata_043494 [Turnera subulata]|uniref:Uncharacterized protein n=1 Tax=Turnera subulata TaxID=218843 RepID=A0A9Q0FS72_9ROSI|nr:hypothetical protein Tsubulata_043494 [Turnera subulata]